MLKRLKQQVGRCARTFISSDVRDVIFHRLSVQPLTDQAIVSHIAATTNWLCALQDHGSDPGVSAKIRFLDFWQGESEATFVAPSYPETTGYIIPTFLALSRHLGDPTLTTRALRMGEWLLQLQSIEGGFPGMHAYQTTVPRVFNTGQIMFGLCALYKHNSDPRFNESLTRAARWLVNNLSADGSYWNTYDLRPDIGYHTRVAWPLMLAGKINQNDAWFSAGLRVLNRVTARIRASFWDENWWMWTKEHSFTHSIAYTFEGLLGGAVLTGDTEIIEFLADGLQKYVLPYIGKNGFLPGHFRPTWRPDMAYACLTGNCQFACLLLRLGKILKKPLFLEKADQLLSFVAATQILNHPNRFIRGGVFGSWPISGIYQTYDLVNWAGKFMLDGLLLRQGVDVDTLY